MIYVGLPLKAIWKLQLIQNAAAHADLGVPWLIHITPWFPVCFWVHFKILVIAFKALNGSGLGYAQDHFSIKLIYFPRSAYFPRSDIVETLQVLYFEVIIWWDIGSAPSLKHFPDF